MSVPLRLIAAVLAVALCATAAGCGSGDGVAGRSAPDTLRTTFGPGKEVRSGRLDVGLEFEAQGLAGVDGPVRVHLRGPFSARQDGRGIPDVALDLSVSAGGQAVRAGAVSTGASGFLTYGGTAYAVDAATWGELERRYLADQERAGDREGQTLAALGIDPLRWLRDPERVGEEDVAGVPTVHVRAGVDVGALLEDVDRILARAGTAGAGRAAGRDVPTGLTPAQRGAIAAAVRSAGLDVFTGRDDGILRRLNVQVSFAVPEAARADAGGLRAGRLGLDLRLAEVNEPQDIRAPRGARPLAEGLGGAGTAAAPAAPAGGTYDRCLADAGGDLRRAQDCAGLVGAP